MFERIALAFSIVSLMFSDTLICLVSEFITILDNIETWVVKKYKKIFKRKESQWD